MIRLYKIFIIIYGILFFMSSQSQAVVGVRALSLGGAYVAVGGDGSALYWNPVSLVNQEKMEDVFEKKFYLSSVLKISASPYPEFYVAMFGISPLLSEKKVKRCPGFPLQQLKDYKLVSSRLVTEEGVESPIAIKTMSHPNSILNHPFFKESTQETGITIKRKKKFIEISYFKEPAKGILNFWAPSKKELIKTELLPYAGNENVLVTQEVFVREENCHKVEFENPKFKSPMSSGDLKNNEKANKGKEISLLHSDQIDQSILNANSETNQHEGLVILGAEKVLSGISEGVLNMAFSAVTGFLFGGGDRIYLSKQVIEKEVIEQESMIDEYHLIDPDIYGGGCGFMSNMTKTSSNSYNYLNWLQFSGFYFYEKYNAGLGLTFRGYGLNGNEVSASKDGFGLDISGFARVTPKLNAGFLIQDIISEPIRLTNGNSIKYLLNAYFGLSYYSDDSSLFSVQADNLFSVNGAVPGLCLGYEFRGISVAPIRLGINNGSFTWGVGCGILGYKIDIANLTRNNIHESIWITSFQGSF